MNAAGAWSPTVCKRFSGSTSLNKAPIATRSARPSRAQTVKLKPLVADLSDGLYFSQSTRGEIVGGIGNEYVPEGL